MGGDVWDCPVRHRSTQGGLTGGVCITVLDPSAGPQLYARHICVGLASTVYIHRV